MAQIGRKQFDVVPDSPAVKRQRTATGYQSTSNSVGYNSDVDSGDELFEGITTPAASRHFTQPTQLITQPTQIIDRSLPPSSPTTSRPVEIQIPASSPFRHELVSSPIPVQPAQPVNGNGGRLASMMAPAGTVFKLPNGVRYSPIKALSTRTTDFINLADDEDDDDGPQYVGSSDDDGRSRADIRPSEFKPRSNKNSFTGISAANSGVHNGQTPHFRDLTASFAYVSGAANGQDSPGNIHGRGSASGPKKFPHSQTRPERAMPVMHDLALEDIPDEEMRRKVQRIKNMNPSAFSVTMIRNALIIKKGSVDDAAELLMLSHKPTPIEISEDELSMSPNTQPEPQFKRQLNAPIKSMVERYSSNQKKTVLTSSPAVATPPAKPKRKLMQGRRHPSSPALPVELLKVASPLPAVYSEQDTDSGIASQTEEDPALDGRVLQFLNECQIGELVDLANIKVETATIMLSKRPFKNLEAARRVSDAKATKTGKKSTKAPVGEKIVQTASDMMAGYEAVDALVAKCDELGRPLKEEMTKWGFDMFGASKGGEIEMTSLDDAHDSGIGTPNSKPTSQNGDVGEDDVKVIPRKNRQNNFLKKPANMADEIVMKDYQLVGLNWLALLYKHRLSCILADDMGLGKTCQVIAFISHLAETGETGPHLVIVPSSTLENWLREFNNFSPGLVIEPYYGSQAERRDAADRILEQRDSVNVVVSTYDFAAKPEDNKFMRRLRPNVCIFDEGHVLKNPKSLKYQGLVKIPAHFRVLLTGTPLQNNLMELAALLGFILPELFRSRAEELDFIFKHKASTRDADHAALLSAQRINRAKSMLAPFVLRRKKDQVLKHMPTKTCRVEYCDMLPAQAAIYEGLRDKARERARLRLTGEKIPNDGENNPLMQLRKAAIHPQLFRRHFTDAKLEKMLDLLKKHEPDEFSTARDKIMLEMQAFSDFYLHIWCRLYPCIAKFDVPDLAWMDSGKVVALVRLLNEYKANGDRVLIFSQFTLVLDVLDAVLNSARISYTRFDGATRVNERQTLIDNFRDDDTITAFLLSTGAGGTGVNLMFANKVIIFDGSFNPQDDVQAENRAHRLGQKRDVEVVRLVTRGTIEEQIYALGQSKLALDSKVNGDDDANLSGEKLVAKLMLEAESKSTHEVSVKQGVEVLDKNVEVERTTKSRKSSKASIALRSTKGNVVEKAKSVDE